MYVCAYVCARYVTFKLSRREPLCYCHFKVQMSKFESAMFIYFHCNYNWRLKLIDLHKSAHSQCSLLSTLHNNYNLRKLVKSRPDCTKPAQPPGYFRQYFGNVCKIESNCAQYLASAGYVESFHLPVSVCNLPFRNLHWNQLMNYYNEIKYHSLSSK